MFFLVNIYIYYIYIYIYIFSIYIYIHLVYVYIYILLIFESMRTYPVMLFYVSGFPCHGMDDRGPHAFQVA
jgi:hypothetical protein